MSGRQAKCSMALLIVALFPVILQRDGKIDKDELHVQYEALGYKPRKQTEYGISEVEDVIWEVSITAGMCVVVGQNNCIRGRMLFSID